MVETLLWGLVLVVLPNSSLYPLNLNMELKPHLLYDRLLQSPAESSLSLLIKDEFWSWREKTAITTRLRHCNIKNWEIHTVLPMNHTVFQNVNQVSPFCSVINTAVWQLCRPENFYDRHKKKHMPKPYLGVIFGEALSKDSHNNCLGPRQNKWCIVWPQTTSTEL